MAAEPSKALTDSDPPLYDADGHAIPIGFESQADYEAWLKEEASFVQQ